MKTFRVLVTGASGFLGVALVSELVRSGFDVTGVSRLPRNSIPGVRWVIADLVDFAGADALVQNVDIVINGAAKTANLNENRASDAFYQINRDAALELFRASVKAGVRAFVQISSTGVFGPGEGRFDENTPCHPRGSYEKSKLEAERALQEAAKSQQVRLSIVRPSNVFGKGHPRRKLLTWLKTVKQGHAVLASNFERNWVNYIYLEDVTRAITALARDLLEVSTISTSDVLILNCPATARQFFDASAFGLGVKPKTHVLPESALKLLGAGCDAAAAVLRRPLPMTREKAHELTNRQIFIADRAKRALPGFPWVGLRNGLRITCDYYRAQGML